MRGKAVRVWRFARDSNLSLKRVEGGVEWVRLEIIMVYASTCTITSMSYPRVQGDAVETS